MARSNTIAAVSTPRGAGGIAVIRISGEEAFSICDRIFTPISDKLKPSEMNGYTCAFGRIEYDGEFHDYGFNNNKKLLSKTQVNDRIKTEFCEKNNIPFLRIRYDNFSNYTEVLLSFLKENNLV